MDRVFLKSPFENVLNFLNVIPQGHEKALKHALYNAIALSLLFVCGAAGWGLFYILEPFVKPLIWALLIGSVLHPFKYSLARRFEQWFCQLDASSTPIFFNILMVPVRLIDDLSETIGNLLMSYIKLLLGLGGGIVAVFLVYTYIPNICISLIVQICDLNYRILIFFMENMSVQILIAFIIGYIVILSLFWSPEHGHIFSVGSYVLWFLISLFCAKIFGILKIPLFLFMIFAFAFGFTFQVVSVLNVATEDISWWKVLKDVIQGKANTRTGNELLKGSNSEKSKPVIETSSLDDGKGEPAVKNTVRDDSESKDEDSSDGSRSVPYKKPHRVSSLPLATRDSLQKLETRIHDSPVRKNTKGEDDSAAGEEDEMEESSKYIYGVLWACLFMLMWKHTWIVHLLPIPIAVYFVKHIGLYFGVWKLVFSHCTNLFEDISNWIKLREAVLFPAPVQGLFKFGIGLRFYIMNSIKDSINSFASSLVIFGLIFFTFSFSVFIALQIYAEGIHLVTVAASVINSTVVHNPEFLQLLPEGWGDKMESALNNAYLYGREGISNQVRSLLKDVDKAKAAEFEKHVLEFWDRVYQAWLMGSMESSSNVGPKVSSSAVFTSWENFLDMMQKTPDLFNVGVMTEFAKENVGTLMSLLESVWMLLKGNIHLVFQFLFATLSVVLGGGTAVLNFAISTIVFLTALFYLLSSSGVLYKPVDWLSNFGPVNGNKLGMAFEAAVTGVFKASFKMALFYGLWTWLIHNLFRVRIVYLPSVLAAVLGAVPFLGTYWASVPAVLDLWLAQHKGFQAVVLFLFQCLPVSFVDAAIYTEIKEGGHPYMTGLAIAGGVFCMGIEGAILGPLLLCCLLVALNMSSSLMKESPSDQGISSISVRKLRRMDTVM